MRPYFPALNALGLVLILFALVMLFPLVVSFALHDGATTAYDMAMIATASCGALLWKLTARGRRDLRPHDAFLLVALTWIVIPVFGALPLLAFLPELSITDAYFEAASGLTTTGATVLTGLDRLPISINLWRTFMHWIGGMGVIVLMVAILPLLGVGGRQIFRAEAPGPMKESSLTPRIAETAKGLWAVYVVLTLACGLSLWAAGMAPWDAVIHSFSITGLGGFSSRDASLGHFDSVPIELVTIVFALIAGCNYATHYLALIRRNLSAYALDPEIPWFVAVVVGATALLTGYLLSHDVYPDLVTTVRHVGFHVVSIATSLGLATQDYSLWPMFPQLLMLFLGSFAPCSGSTGGGIKMIRALILYKQIYREVVRSLHPGVTMPVRVGGGSPVKEHVLMAVLGFSFMYMVSIVTLTLILSVTGLDIVTAFSAVVACINNTGPGLGAVGPASNYQGLSDFQTWVLSLTMILGRLEIFTLLVVLTPAFWRR
ncbi:MAG: TrkH family potassium uptake protein [Rhodocyclales bacterium]|nr:TrkH family potassium uptake protein [Rhodocyclales bacterium]